MASRQLLVIEDGNEYAEFARLFLQPDFVVHQALSAAATLAMLGDLQVDALLIDMRFDRSPVEALLGDVGDTAARLFGGSQARAVRYLQDQQGILILAALRSAGHKQPAVFIHDFPARRLANLQRLYGSVQAVPTFDAGAIRQALKVTR